MATKIYTKTGDDGTTGLFGGVRVPKYDLRIEAYGTVDELSSVLGVVLANDVPDRLRNELEALHALLFTVGADLATPLQPPPQYAIPRIGATHIEHLERLIDANEAELEPLKNFILPGGSSTAAYLHVARTVCRRAERRTVELAQHEDVGDYLTTFLNRLSDYFFVTARLANKFADIGDVAWKNPMT